MRPKVSQSRGCGNVGFPQRTRTFHEEDRPPRATFVAVLSLVVIAKNERHNLARCIRSVEGLADEVVVVDSGSTDGTSALAESLGARVLQRPFTTYADQKNWAADQATQPFVLSLDADEALSDELRRELLAWKAQVSSNEVGAWSMPRLTQYCGTWIRHGGWYPDRKVRLWSKGSGHWRTAHEGATLHEAWCPDPEVSVKKLSGDLLHYSYHTTADHHRQFAKFSFLGAQDAILAGRSSHRWKPVLRAAFQWTKQALIQSGWRDGAAGWEVARWSGVAAYWKWTMVNHLDTLSRWQTVGIARTDALGDNVLTLPLAGAIKAFLPHVRVVWLCRSYAAPLASRSSVVDEVRVWDEAMSPEAEAHLLKGLDAVVFGFPEPRLMAASARARVPLRVATGRRWSGLRWANRRTWRSRKRRPEHETLQGLRLLHALSLPARWRFPEPEDWRGLTGLRLSEGRETSTPWSNATVLHPGNHGSANGWPLSRFEDLAARLMEAGHAVVVTGSPSERSALQGWLDRMKDAPLWTDAVGTLTLDELTEGLGQAQCVVASSTGPLHIASAQGTPTVGLYRGDAPFWPERWAPLGEGEVLKTSRILPEGGLDLAVDDVHDAVLRVLASEGA